MGSCLNVWSDPEYLNWSTFFVFAEQIKKYFELEPLARGKRWILDGCSTDNMETVKESFCQFISLLEDKDTEPARIWC